MKAIRLIVPLVTCYATLRYNVFKGVAWDEWPIYVVNKVFALSALLLVVRCIIQQRGRGSVDSKLLSVAGSLMLMHIALSLAILDPAYYPKFFTGSKLTMQGGLSMLVGAISAAGIHYYFRSCANREASCWINSVGVFALLAGVHAGLLGYPSWLSPATWPGYMVPITLISFVTGVAALVISISARAKAVPGSAKA